MSFFGWLRDLLCRLFNLGCRCRGNPPPASCPIAWQPSVMAAVFFGVRELDEPPVALGALAPGGPGIIFNRPPGPGRVFFPSLDGSEFTAPILEGCSRYPLIIFCHGHCHNEPGHFRKWFELPATLARSGYVVLVPELPQISSGGHPSGADSDLALLDSYETWMRNTWLNRDVLLPDRTGVIGHSFGALLAARYALNGRVAAYASISGVWQDWPDSNRPIKSLTIPKFFTWGEQDFDLDIFTEIRPNEWNTLPLAKHRAVFPGAGHWDNLPAGASRCEKQRGKCSLVGMLTRDLATTFFGKYLPPEAWPELARCIPDSLIAPVRHLSSAQKPFDGGHLQGFKQLGSNRNCRVQLAWETTQGAGSVTKP